MAARCPQRTPAHATGNRSPATLKRTKNKLNGIIASNVYDLAPLVERLKLVASLYPALSPRTIKAAKAQMPADPDKVVPQRRRRKT